jgi:glycosyltransferase involved in cell wall biosynthesis
LRNIIRRIILLNKIIKEGDYTDVVSFLSSPNFYNALLKKKQVNTIVSIRNYKQDSLLASKIFNRFIYSRVDKIVVVSERIREKIALNYKEETQNKLITIYNPVSKAYQKNNVPVKERISIITVGRLVEQKAQWLLIEAFYNLLNISDKELHLDICGDGPFRKILEEQVKRLEIFDKVSFHGEVKNVSGYLLNSDIFVMTSLNEGFPNAILEAMSVGLPIISTDCLSGPREILTKKDNLDSNHYIEYGVLVSAPISSANIYESIIVNKIVIDELKEALLSLVNNDDLRNYYSKKSLKRIKDFSEERILFEWESIISN